MINFTTVWDRAGIKHVTPGSAVRRESVVKNVTDCDFCDMMMEKWNLIQQNYILFID